jgi:uncharacterized protein
MCVSGEIKMAHTVLSSPSTPTGSIIRSWVNQHQLLSFFVLSYVIMFASVFGSMWFKVSYYGPLWFFSIFSPTISALVVSGITGGPPAVKKLLHGYIRWNVSWRWYLAALTLLLFPLTIGLIYQASGYPSQGLVPGTTVPTLLGLFVFTFFSGPFAEEAGWRGFALPRLQSRYNALVSSLILGVIWTCWHIPLYFHPEPGSRMFFPAFLGLNIFLSIYFTWLYNNTRGSLVITILAHFAFNLVGGFVTGLLGIIPMNVFLMVGVPGLMILTAWILFYFRPHYLSRKPVSELPFQPKAKII